MTEVLRSKFKMMAIMLPQYREAFEDVARTCEIEIGEKQGMGMEYWISVMNGNKKYIVDEDTGYKYVIASSIIDEIPSNETRTILSLRHYKPTP